MLQTTLITLFISLFFLQSCSDARQKKLATCTARFKQARELAYGHYTRVSALDSALQLANACLQCDSIKKEVVDFKIMLLIQLQQYAEGIRFVDSLPTQEFARLVKGCSKKNGVLFTAANSPQ